MSGINPSGILEDYDRIWDSREYDRTGIETAVRQRMVGRRRFYDALCRWAKKRANCRILEIGCGTALDLNILGQTLPSAVLFGSDFSKHSINLSLKVTEFFNSRAHFFVSDTRRIPLREGAFDLIFSQGLLEHFEDPHHVLEEQIHALASGGILITSVPQKYTYYTIMKRRMIRKAAWRLGWETAFSYNDLKRMGRACSLIEREVFGYQYYLSWFEPTFVLRDFYDKFHRRNPFRESLLFQMLERKYTSLWETIEKKWGHYFLQNIVMVFEKP